MRKFLFFMTLISTSALAGTQTVNSLTQSLKMWQPLGIQGSNNEIQIILNEDRVTNQIYTAVAGSGICPVLWEKSQANSAEKITEIQVLNRYMRQGFVLEQPLKTCIEAGQQTNSELTILSNTHGFMNK
ncbi:hypothetical protein [Pantoea agglomerans]|uniref:hypothetical protein n=1 Tax=Enterobacter agglomerans TaxID=549 RepID=UPI003DA16D59